MKMPATLSARIEQAISQLTPEPVGHINYEGTRYGALPLFGTLGAVWLLRPDGSLWRADSDAGLALEPLPEELRMIALVEGTERYPWLGELLPRRPVGAVSCSDCGGRGRLGPGGVTFCKSCNALGWRPIE